MKLTVSTYNGTNINDGTNYIAYFPEGSIFKQPDVEAVEIERSNKEPVYSGQIIQSGHTIPLCIIMKGTIRDQIDDLRALINTKAVEPVSLVCTDESSVSWYINVKPVGQPEIDGQMITFLLSVSDTFWRASTNTTDSWSITTTGSTHAISNGGHLVTKPTFLITPGTAGGHGLTYAIFSQVRERYVKEFKKYPLDVANASFDSAALLSSESHYVLINNGSGITADATTIDIDGAVGTLGTSGTAMIETEQISFTGNSGSQLTGVTRGINGSTAATHADDTPIKKSTIQYSGDDVRVFIDGIDVNRWFGDWNTATTTVWVNIDLKPKVQMTLRTAIADSGSVSTIDFAHTTTTTSMLKKMPSQGIVVIDDERFTYTSIFPSAWKLDGVTRAAKDSSMAAHTAGDICYWIEHDIWICYGNADIEAKENDDYVKPIITLDSSSNTVWDYTEFFDFWLLRSGIWKPSVLKTSNTTDPTNTTHFYTDDADADADPATTMGMAIMSFQSGTIWKAESGIVIWSLNNPAGFVHVQAANGEKYRYATSWASTCVLQKSTTGSTWSAVWSTEATPTSAQTWQDWSNSKDWASESVKTYYYLRFYLGGTSAASANNAYYYDVEAITLELNSSQVPLVTLGSSGGSYHLLSKITNTTTSEWIEIDFRLPLNTGVTINCEDKKILGPDGDRYDKVIKFSSRRQEWLDIRAGSNVLQFDDAGTAGVTLYTSFKKRNP